MSFPADQTLETSSTVGLVLAARDVSRAKMLDTKGANAAAISDLSLTAWAIGAWLLILLGFLLSSHKATKWRFDEKKALGLANPSDDTEAGPTSWPTVRFPASICIYAYMADDWDTVVWVFGAAVAVAASDTFASEIGCLDPRVRMITTLKPCEQGENGGFSPNGQLAAAVGSTVVAVLTFWLWTTTTDSASTQRLESYRVGRHRLAGLSNRQLSRRLLENRGYMSKGR